MFKVCEFRGIPTYISGSLLLFVGTIVALESLPSLFAGDFSNFAVKFIKSFNVLAVLYAIVTVHEYGHAIAAKRRGYGKNTEICLYPFAGLASIDGDWYKDPKDEFWISVWGPLTNLFMAVGSLLICLMLGHSDNFFVFLIQANVILFMFNILPIYPMDGGRIVRCCLTGIFRGDVLRATWWAATISSVATVVLAPTLWIYMSPIGAGLIAIMGIVGWGDYLSLSRAIEIEEENRKEREENLQKKIALARPMNRARLAAGLIDELSYAVVKLDLDRDYIKYSDQILDYIDDLEDKELVEWRNYLAVHNPIKKEEALSEFLCEALKTAGIDLATVSFLNGEKC